MRFGLGSAPDVGNRDAAREKSICDQRAMAAPGHRFRAHDRDGGFAFSAGLPVCFEMAQRFQIAGELFGLHVIGITAKTVVSPSGVDRILAGMAQAAETGHVLVGDLTCGKRFGQRFAIKLRIIPGAGNGADIDQEAHVVGFQKFDECRQRPVGMTHG